MSQNLNAQNGGGNSSMLTYGTGKETQAGGRKIPQRERERTGRTDRNCQGESDGSLRPDNPQGMAKQER
jgi:hypothetical protein